MPQSKIVATLDKATIHWTLETLKTASSLGMKIVNLPQYCQHLAQAEFALGMVKGYLRSRLSNKIVDYSKGSGKRAIIEGLKWEYGCGLKLSRKPKLQYLRLVK